MKSNFERRGGVILLCSVILFLSACQTRQPIQPWPQPVPGAVMPHSEVKR